MEEPRSAQQRKSDTFARLAADLDAWIATADAAGNGYLVPLSFLWDGAGLIISTPRSSVTARNLSQGGRARVGSWDPREEAGDYAYFRIVPDRVQAWREANELPGRTLMRDGKWLA